MINETGLPQDWPSANEAKNDVGNYEAWTWKLSKDMVRDLRVVISPRRSPWVRSASCFSLRLLFQMWCFQVERHDIMLTLENGLARGSALANEDLLEAPSSDLKAYLGYTKLKSPNHGCCWETVYMFAYCGLVHG